MPGGQTKFAGAWLSHVDTNGQKIGEWCNKGKDDYHGYCQFCNSDIRIDNAGKTQLLQHASQMKHQEAIKYCKDTTQTKLCFPTSQAGPSTSTGATGKITVLINYGDASLASEILWLAKSAYSNYSL